VVADRTSEAEDHIPEARTEAGVAENPEVHRPSLHLVLAWYFHILIFLENDMIVENRVGFVERGACRQKNGMSGDGPWAISIMLVENSMAYSQLYFYSMRKGRNKL
jgi:hypothetical protein